MCDKMLPCQLSGLVVKGFGRGSKALGVPTANLPEHVVDSLPTDFTTGIYYGWASVNGGIYKMVASIGWNPFYKNEKKSAVGGHFHAHALYHTKHTDIHLEVHLLHKFEEDFYGKEIKVIFTGYIRPEKNFNSVEDLIKEINNDIKIAETLLEQPDMKTFKNHEFLSG